MYIDSFDLILHAGSDHHISKIHESYAQFPNDFNMMNKYFSNN